MPAHQFDFGNPLFRWTAHDYHPYERSFIWYAVFFTVMIGIGSFLTFFSGDFGWISGLCFFIIMGLYCYTHKDGEKDHEVIILEKGIMIDRRKVLLWEQIEGYWFNYDPTVAVINFERKSQMGLETIPLQMGDLTPDVFRRALAETDIKEMMDRKESLADLWIRVFKL